MKNVSVLCIGNELLNGTVINTNLSAIGACLCKYGITPVLSMEVPDTKTGIVSALEFALQHSDTVITSGGLGPTADDVTKEFISTRLGLRLEENGDAMRNVQSFWKMKHPDEEIPTRVHNQALVPVGAKVWSNDCGSAPGLLLALPEDHPEFPGKVIIMLPGPPDELVPMLEHHLARYAKKHGESQYFMKEFHVCGVSEVSVEDEMLPILAKHHGSLQAAYCATDRFVRLYLSSSSPDVLGHAIDEVTACFGRRLLSEEYQSLPEEVFALLNDRDETLATAESCTGGLLAKCMTDMPGSSDVFLGSVVSYSNDVKQSVLDVPPEILQKYGAVSKETAEAMISGLAARIPSDAAVAITGIAGPGGAVPGKPVGLVYIAVRYRNDLLVKEFRLRRSRAQIRNRAVTCALDMLRNLMLESE